MKKLFSKGLIFLFVFMMIVLNTGLINAESITEGLTEYSAGGVKTSGTNSFVPAYDDGGKPSSYPLLDYLNGSYYSTKKGGCTCHSWCNENSSCDCIKFDGASQCDGFARYIYYVSHNHELFTSKSYTNVYDYIDVNKAKKLFKGTPTGTYIRVKPTNGTHDHSISIIDTNDSTITIYHANVDGKCKVEYKEYSWADFVSKYSYLYFYLK
ncbi:MAG: hypothetical protein NC203_03070 [Firmicutes bacterium]|nr:hypothetical protein [[Eubacterium] siraeum]MCM1487326.1 hypothetical protein [Bacillota bacterium]